MASWSFDVALAAAGSLIAWFGFFLLFPDDKLGLREVLLLFALLFGFIKAVRLLVGFARRRQGGEP